MDIQIFNRQRAHKVDKRSIRAFALFVFRQLHVDTNAIFEMSFVGPRTMRAANKQLLDHDWVTDVISLNYAGANDTDCAVAGELLIAPSEAARYAKQHGGEYASELLRYVAHGILHWHGMDDATEDQRQAMRRHEDRLLREFAKAKAAGVGN